MRNKAIAILETLTQNGYEASLIGGSIRNALHNSFHNEFLPVKDYDIVTNASYEDVARLFKDVDARGEQFKVAVVKMDGVEFEVAQYRGESYPEEGSLRPDVVYTVQTLQEDVTRRDFTMNGIAHDKDEKMIDYVGGFEDIQNKIIRTIGEPERRFAEDPLRMLRALRFVSQLGYELDRDTADGIVKNLYRLKKIPHERVKEEINKLLRGKHVVRALRLMRDMGVHKHYFYNSILKKEVKMFERVFYMTDGAFETMLTTLMNVDRKEAALSDLYLVLYEHLDVRFAELELNNMMFLNNDDIFRTMLMREHLLLVKQEHLMTLVQLIGKIGEQRGLSYLQDILKSYSMLFGTEFNELQQYLERPLFKYQLPINGNDILEEGKKLGITKPGVWISKVLAFVQYRTIHGENYDLPNLIKTMYAGEEGVKL